MADDRSGDSGGWVGWGLDGPSEELDPEVRRRLEHRIARRRADRGRLLARVEVRLYESGTAEAQRR